MPRDSIYDQQEIEQTPIMIKALEDEISPNPRRHGSQPMVAYLPNQNQKLPETLQSAPYAMQNRNVGALATSSKFADQTESGMINLEQDGKIEEAKTEVISQETANLHQRTRTQAAIVSNAITEGPCNQSRMTEYGPLAESEQNSKQDDITQKKNASHISMQTVSDKEIDAVSLISQPQVPGQLAGRNQPHAFSYDYEGAQTPHRNMAGVSVTEQTSRFAGSRQESQQDSSNFVSQTEIAGSEHGLLTHSQRGLMKVEMSDEEPDVNNKMAQQKINPSAFDTTFRPQERSPTLGQRMGSDTNEFDHKADSSPLGESPHQQYGEKIGQDKDSVLKLSSQQQQPFQAQFTVTAKATQLARSQEAVVSHHEGILTPVSELKQPFDSIRDSGRPVIGIGVESSQAAASDHTIKDQDQEQRDRKIGGLKKESANGLSSENSHQNTRSAVEKGNLMQRDTDPSAGNPNNEDSQQSSHMSQYFHQIEMQDPDRVSISKEIILENDEDCDSGVNADLMHLNSAMITQDSQGKYGVGEGVASVASIPDANNAECSKEDTDMHALSSPNLEYSKSIGVGDNLPAQGSKDTNEEEKSDEVTWSLKGSAHKFTPMTTLLETTPQFNGTTPIILEANIEDSANDITSGQQVNYESDNGGAAPDKSTGRITNGSKQQLHHTIDEPRLSDRESINIELGNNQSYVDHLSEAQPQKTLQGQVSDIYGPNKTFELDENLQILNSDSIYDPKNNTPQVMSGSSLPEGIMVKGNKDIIKIVQEGADDESASRAESNEEVNQYRKAYESSTSGHDVMNVRGSTRFSKGYNDELDKVADKINRSFIQVQDQPISGESFSLKPDDEEEKNKLQEENPYEQDDENQMSNLRRSQDSSSLPKHARSIQKPSQNDQSTTQSKKRRKKRATLELSQGRADAAEFNMLVREQDTPGSGDNSSTIQSRRNSHLNEPRFPDPVEEARQRYSTPRRDINQSPISQKTGQSGSKSRSNNSKSYPVELRKNKVLKGPVLKQHHDQQATIKNGKLRMVNKNLAKKKKNSVIATSKAQQLQQTATITDDSLMMSSTRQARTGPGYQSRSQNKRHSASKTAGITSDESLALSRSKDTCEQPSICLPKKRIKKKGTARVHSNEIPVNNDSIDNSVERAFKHERKPAVPKQAKVNNQLLASKRDVRIGKRKNATGLQPIKFSKSQPKAREQIMTQPSSNRPPQTAAQNPNSSLSEMADVSLISGTFAQKSDIQFDKKITPRYPMPITLENSSIDFQETSNFRTNTLQTSQQVITNMPIDQIYRHLSKNWNKDMLEFEQRCKQVLDDSRYEVEVSQMMSTEEVRSRKQRFELLKQRLLDNQSNQSSKGNRRKLNDQLALQQAQINKNLQELDNLYSNQDTKKDKSKQIGQFQLIFKNPMERFNVPGSPPSPTYSNPPAGRRDHPISAHQSQIQLRQGIAGLAANKGQTRQRSQVLSPKITQSFIDTTVNTQQVMAMNATPIQNVGLIDPNKRQGNLPLFEQQSKSLNATGLINNFKTGRTAKQNDYNNPIQAPQVPNTQYIRAATANNANKKRGSNFTDAFNSSIGFKSSASMARRNLKNPNTGNIPQLTSNLPGLSPSSTGNNQRSLMQKLQYRSMRGRRIKEFLKQVQSQKIDHYTGESEKTKPEQEYADLINMDETTLDQLKPTRGVNSAGMAYEDPPNFNSQSSVLQNNEDYTGGTNSDAKQILNNKLKSPWPGINQSDNVSNSQNSINVMESQKNGAWLSSNRGKEVTTFSNSDAPSKGNVNSSALLNTFLAEQDKRIDFGFCPLYKKVREGEDVHQELQNVDAGLSDDKVLNMEQLESLMNFIKRKNLQTLTKPFQLRSHQECFATIQSLLNELGMGYRARRMQRDEPQIDIERVYVMACRAHKLYRARTELIDIFKMIDQLEEMLPRVKQSVMGKLAVSSSKAISGRSGPLSQNTSGSVVNLGEDDQSELEKKSQELKKVLSKLVVMIPSLLRDYKFFNNSFVFNDKDYMKYLAKEFVEIKGLLSVYNITL